MGRPGQRLKTGKGRGIRVDLVVSRYNEHITGALHKDAYETLLSKGLRSKDVRTFWVPGAMEIPQVLSRLIQKPRAHAAIGIGCVIRGETSHHDQVGRAVIDGIARLSLVSKIPLMSCILTVNNLKQAQRRTSGPVGRKGKETAEGALEMIAVYKQFRRA